jgi:hypothetical protein
VFEAYFYQVFIAGTYAFEILLLPGELGLPLVTLFRLRVAVSRLSFPRHSPGYGLHE